MNGSNIEVIEKNRNLGVKEGHLPVLDSNMPQTVHVSPDSVYMGTGKGFINKHVFF